MRHFPVIHISYYLHSRVNYIYVNVLYQFIINSHFCPFTCFILPLLSIIVFNFQPTLPILLSFVYVCTAAGLLWQ